MVYMVYTHYLFVRQQLALFHNLCVRQFSMISLISKKAAELYALQQGVNINEQR